LIPDMPRPRKPYLHHQKNRHGQRVWYVRKGKGKRYRLRAEFGSDEFNRQYDLAIQGKLPQRGQATAGTLRWLWDSYRKVDAWKALSPATRKQRENIMLHVLKLSGEEPFGAIDSDDITAGLDARADTPSAARNFLDTMRGLYQWAKSRGHVRRDPTADVKPPKRRRNSGFAPWTHEDVDAYRKRWKPGTPQRVWLDVLLYTGLRRGDAALVGPKHVKDGHIEIWTEKSQEMVLVTLPILDVLQATLDVGPIGAETWIVGERGNRLTKESFGNAFSEAASAAGVKKSAHGVRKIAATIAAENGATEAELDALFGWTGGRMAAHYTKTANRARLAKQAAEKLKSIPSPLAKVGAQAQNTQTDQPHSNGLVGEAEVKSPSKPNHLPESEGQ
jgi:integrase